MISSILSLFKNFLDIPILISSANFIGSTFLGIFALNFIATMLDIINYKNVSLNKMNQFIKEFTNSLKNDKQAQPNKVGKPIMDKLLVK